MKKREYNYQNVIRTLRIKHNMSQDDAARVLGITRVSYANKELGKTKFDIREVMQLFKYMDEGDLNVLKE